MSGNYPRKHPARPISDDPEAPFGWKKDGTPRKVPWGRHAGDHQTALRSPAMKRARAEIVVEKVLKGIPKADIAREHNLCQKTVYNIVKEAEEQGIVEQVRDRLKMQTIPKAVNVWNAVLDAPPELLEANPKAWDLKTKVAKHLGAGLGVLKTEKADTVKVKQTLSLEDYTKIYMERNAGNPSDEIVEGEVGLPKLSGGVDDPDPSGTSGG